MPVANHNIKVQSENEKNYNNINTIRFFLEIIYKLLEKNFYMTI